MMILYLIYFLALTMSLPIFKKQIDLTQYKSSLQHITRIQIFQKIVNSIFNNSNCASNKHIIQQYINQLQTHKIQSILSSSVSVQKLLLDQMLSAGLYDKIFNELSSNITQYQICKADKNISNLKKPSLNMQYLKRQMSVKSTLQYYPYLSQKISSNSITQMLSILPHKLKQQLYMARFIVFQNKIYRQIYNEQDLWNDFVWKLHKLNKKLPDMDFVVYMWDTINQQFIHQYLIKQDLNLIEYDTKFEFFKKIIIELPAFMWSKDLNNSLQFNKLLLINNLVNHREWENTFTQVKEFSRKIDWDCKIDKAYYKGSILGRQNQSSHKQIKTFSRLNLINISKHYPNYIETRLMNYYYNQFHQLLQEPSIFITQQLTPIKNQIHYKYLISIDGWTASWKRLPWTLLSNSLVLKQQTTRVQWFYSQLKPNIHYLPIKQDLSDLIQKIIYARNNDNLMRRISNQATIFAQQKFKQSKLYSDFLNILIEYAQIQNISSSPPQLDRLRVEGLDYVSQKSIKYQIQFLRKQQIDIIQLIKDNTGNIIQGSLVVLFIILVLLFKLQKYTTQNKIEFSLQSLFQNLVLNFKKTIDGYSQNTDQYHSLDTQIQSNSIDQQLIPIEQNRNVQNIQQNENEINTNIFETIQQNN